MRTSRPNDLGGASTYRKEGMFFDLIEVDSKLETKQDDED